MIRKLIFIILFAYSSPCLSQDGTVVKANASYREALVSVNNVFLKKIFINNYMNNSDYFINTDLSKEDPKADLVRANVLLNSMKLTLVGDSLKVCNEALNFNENYMKLFEIKNGLVLKSRYDKEKVNLGISAIDSLPAISAGSKLDITKTKIKNILRNYATSTTILKAELEKNKKGDPDNPDVKKKYLSLEKKYLDYPFLIKAIQKAKTNKTNDLSELDIPLDPSKP